MLRQEDCELQVSLGYIARPCLNKNTAGYKISYEFGKYVKNNTYKETSRKYIKIATYFLFVYIFEILVLCIK
jgi:hypothetical protein